MTDPTPETVAKKVGSLKALRGVQTALAQLSANDIAALSKPQLLQLALQESLESGPFNDTKIWAFSCRRSNGAVDKPLPLYANSAVLRANSAYFDGCKCNPLLIIYPS